MEAVADVSFDTIQYIRDHKPRDRHFSVLLTVKDKKNLSAVLEQVEQVIIDDKRWMAKPEEKGNISADR